VIFPPLAPFWLLCLLQGVSFCIGGKPTSTRLSGTVKKPYKLGLQFDRPAKKNKGFLDCFSALRERVDSRKGYSIKPFGEHKLFILIYSFLELMAS